VPSLDQFSLDAEISLSEVRSGQTLTDRLQAHHRLRLRRRNELVGVLLDRDAWTALVRYVDRLEAEVELREDEAARLLIAEREPRAAFESGSAERAEEIFDEADRAYERLREGLSK
jgi:hypothetical protein